MPPSVQLEPAPLKPTVMITQRHLQAFGAALGDGYVVLHAWEDPDAQATAEVRAIIVAGEFALDKGRLEALPKLALIACFTSGYDGVDVGWARSRGLAVTHAPSVNHEDVADHALGLIIASRRRIVTGDRQVREGGWSSAAKMLTGSLAGQRVGVVGLGMIGQAVARRCEAMRMPVTWWGPSRKDGASWPRAASLIDLARASDVLVVACRADETNRRMISREVMDALGPAGLLVNVARGQLVDEAALIDALKAHTLGSAALDVFEQEPTPPARWADAPNVILTPHTAGATREGVDAMVGLLKGNLEAFFAGRPLLTPVD